MKIFHLSSTTLDSHYYENLCRGLADNGFSLVLGSLTEKNKPSWISSIPNTEYYWLNASNKISYPFIAYKLSQILKQENVNVLHTHLYDASLIGAFIRRFSKKIKVVVSRHHLDLVHLLGTRIHVEIDKLTTKSTDLTIVPSVVTRDFMIDVEHLNSNKIKVINYGFDFRQFSATEEDRKKVRSDYGLNDEFVVGCVGHLQENKGQRYLLEAAAILKEEIPNIKVLLFGKVDDGFIQPMILENNLSESVILGGFRKDVADCMKAMDVLVHPSLSESFSQVIVEAMSVGTPVIATPCGIAPEVIVNDESGFIVPFKDSQQIADRLRKIYKSAGQTKKITERAKKIVQEKFTLENFVRLHVESYHDLFKK